MTPTALPAIFRDFQARCLIRRALACLLLIVTPSLTAATNQELSGVKNEISRQQQALSQQQKSLDQLQQTLKQQELGINGIERQISKTKTDLDNTNRNIAQINSNIQALQTQQQQQAEQLEHLLQTYYLTKRSLSSSPFFHRNADEDRISQYYQHLAKKRTQAIADLEKTQAELNASQQQRQRDREQIEKLLAQQTQQRDQLAKTQNERKQTVKKIESSISGDKVYLAELQRNETRLKAEIAKAAKRNAVLMNGIANQRGKLPWPIKGRPLHHFGERQTGQIDWKGLVIEANYGQEVKAVYPGTIVFAEYLRGYGLVVLLDHGKGDMTLYGFNQTLLKKEGDKVIAGETIALAGDTGGQSRASLYFEIRRNSRAENPTQWLVR
ncbi:murein hydrolase activator EnvC [Vibrio sp. dsl-7]|uniref:Murein hydrolase activator EnvC n=1 Tax=Vibrio chanodichtyis TaxID=3027932 RepID=A0ABT5V2P6_9VIBR|nr:murein hydrolase activator EnvC [Vibrio chanodichtyis]MDE1515930.1 murein hydrolase activator EnvC [Vibrio chanodichtyis]